MKKACFTAIVLLSLIVAAVSVTSSVLARNNTPEKTDWSRLKIVTFASGFTGFFDPETGKFYIYDRDLDKCHSIIQLIKLGDPTITVRE